MNKEIVYLIESAGLYKVGMTKNLKRRLKAYRTHNPELRVVKVWEGLEIPAIHLERRIHKMLEMKRVSRRKEWFKLEREYVDFLVTYEP